MKAIEGVFIDVDNEIECKYEIRWDFDLDGSIEVQREGGSVIRITGPNMEEFLSRYLKGRKIESIQLQPKGFIKN